MKKVRKKPTKAEERQAIVDEALVRLRVHVAAGMGVRADALPGMEGSVIALAVEAIVLRKRMKRAHELVRRMIEAGRVSTDTIWVTELVEILESRA